MRTAAALRDGSDQAVAKHATLAERVTSLEATIAAMQQTLDVQFKRMASMQAAIDHLIVSGKRSDSS